MIYKDNSKDAKRMRNIIESVLRKQDIDGYFSSFTSPPFSADSQKFKSNVKISRRGL